LQTPGELLTTPCGNRMFMFKATCREGLEWAMGIEPNWLIILVGAIQKMKELATNMQRVRLANPSARPK
jgi:hypothetical protein